MEYFVGIILALAVGFFGTIVGLDRDRSFYPAIMIAVFLGLTIAGCKRSLWLVVVALAGHGAFDVIHGRLITNAGVPSWWPHFCLAYDVVAAAYLAVLLLRSRVRAAAT